MLTITHEPICQMSPMVSAQAMIGVKQREQIEIEEAIKRFKKAGGKITVYATPAVVAPRTKTQRCMDEKRKVAQSNIRRDRGKGSLKYISLKPGKNPQVIYNGKYVGSFESIPLAQEARDKYLTENNLPPVGD